MNGAFCVIAGTDPDTKALLRHIFLAGESDYGTLGEHSYGSSYGYVIA